MLFTVVVPKTEVMVRIPDITDVLLMNEQLFMVAVAEQNATPSAP